MVPGVDYTFVGLWFAGILALMAVGVSVNRREPERHRVRLAVVERKLDALLDHLGVEVPEPHLQQVEAMLRQGKTVRRSRRTARRPVRASGRPRRRWTASADEADHPTRASASASLSGIDAMRRL
jgi:hypothetical protein